MNDLLEQGTGPALSHATGLYRAGRFREAERACRRILAAEPAHVRALQLLALIADRAGHKADATSLLRRAVACAPNDPLPHLGLGDILASAGQLDDALAAYDRAHALDPASPFILMSLAQARHRRGDLAGAENAYRAALAAKPDHAAAHNNLGSLLQIMGRLDEAAAACRRAIALDPDLAAAHNSLGNVLVGQGRRGEAETCYRRAVALDPRSTGLRLNLARVLIDHRKLDEAHAILTEALVQSPQEPELHRALARIAAARDDAGAARTARAPEAAPASEISALPGRRADTARLFERAHAEQADGRLNDAEATCRELLALDDGDAGAWHLLGIVALRSGAAESAVTHIERAAALAPARADCRHSLGFALRALGRDSDAEAAFRQAVALDPDLAEAHFQLANLLREGRRYAEAEASYCRLLELRPDHHQAHNNLGAVLGELRRFAEAAGHFRQAADLRPGYAEAHSNLGHALRAGGHAGEAEAACRRAIELAPRLPVAHLNLGLALQDLGRLDEALASFRQAGALDPGYGMAAACEGILHLLRGNLAAGWEKYEARWRIGDLPPRNFAQPQWRGDPLAGRTILLHAEQGFGDTIQFLRYAPLVAARGGKVVVEVQQSLMPVAARIANIAAVPRGRTLPAFDLHCPLLSLPAAFGTTLDSIPDATPYLSAAPERLSHWRQRLGTGPALKVGIAWAGSPVHRNDRNRSIPAESIAPLLEVPGVRWFSLQADRRVADIVAIRQAPITDLAAELTDFGETAAAIAALDMVIAADTAVAHLAGALAKPVWVMLPFSPDWRWLLGRTDSPWYRSVRLFRQERRGDWTGVVAAIGEALGRRVDRTRAPTAPAERARYAALVSSANEHHQAQRYAECEAVLRPALAIDPTNASAWHVLARTRYELGDKAEAIELMQQAVALEPAASYLSNLGIMLHGAGRFAEALDVTSRSLALNPDHAPTYNSLGATLANLGRLTEAITAYRRALALDPNSAECWTNLAQTQQGLMQIEEAADSYRRAIAIRGDHAPAQCSAAMLALLRGDYPNGLTQFEWRWRLKILPPRDFKEPLWQGEALGGRTILLHAEQGLGDTIQCLRFVPGVAARGGRLVLEMPGPLTRLATSLPAGGEIVTRGRQLPRFDVHCAFMSLPRVLGITHESIPAPVPYLHPDAAVVERWSRRLADATGLKVGIVWAGNPDHANDRRRSIAVERLGPLLAVRGVCLYSLQVGERASDLARLPAGRVVDLAPDLQDFAETAGVLANLDLLIAVDTSIVHLAGAIGRPCWVMLPFSPDWRWLIDRPDSPWYPTLRLFRQSAIGDWDGVIERLRGALAGLVAARAPSAPDVDVDALHVQALELRRAGRPTDTAALCRRILQARPDHGPALKLLGVISQEDGDHKTAAGLLARAAERSPGDAETHYNLGLALVGLDRASDAVEQYRRAVALKPDWAELHNNLGNALRATGALAEAETALRRALALAPEAANAHNNLGTVLEDLGRLPEAAECYRQALARRADFAEASLNLGHVLQRQGRHDEALSSYRTALTIRLDYAEAHLAESFLLLLTRRDFAEGLAKLEWRWRLPSAKPRAFRQPLWLGETLDRRTVLLHAEQGFGDTLQFLRYVPMVARRVGRVVLEVPAGLRRLAAAGAGAGVDVVAAGEPLPAFDAQCPLMSLPLAFGTTFETIPAEVPYLAADAAASARWRERLQHAGEDLRIGIAWAGNPRHADDRIRSIALEELAPLLGLAGTRWFSLQVGERSGDVARFDGVIDLAPDLADFAETAAAMAGLDLVVTVDTAVAHLAGALGKPGWILLPFAPDWRWFLGRDDSPWYPSARLFRQPAPGDWDGAIESLRAALVERVANHAANERAAALALDQRYWAAVALREAKRAAQAETIARGILASDPSHRPTINLLAVMREEAGDRQEAVDLFARLVKLAPDDAEAHYNLGTVLGSFDRLVEAIEHLRRAVALNPAHAKAHSNLGSALRAHGQLDDAEAACRRALALDPHSATACSNLGTVLASLDRLDEAAQSFRRATELKPDLAEAFLNLGLALHNQGRLEEALAQYRRAAGIRPDYADAHMAEAFVLLTMGRDFTAAFAKLEWRWRLSDRKARGFEQPLWRGEALEGRTILLHAEQGFGDSLMLLRYAPMVAARGGRVVIELPKGLVRLAMRLAGGPFAVIGEGAALPPFDMQCPLMSLPAALGTTLETIPGAVPYLDAEPAAVEHWKGRLAGAPGLKVGLAWAGSPEHRNDRHRSVALDRLAELLDLPGVRWFSLQVGKRAGDLATLRPGQVADLSPELSDFAETAAAIANLDLVISVDTAAAHLAGALGRPVWVLLPFNSDWRWLAARDDSPWYPTARLFRQHAPGRWDEAVAALGAALRRRLDAGAPARPQPAKMPMLDRRHVAAVALIEAKRIDEGESALRSILADEPGHAPTLRRLAWMHHQRGDNDAAARLLAGAVAREPDNAEAHYNLGLVLGALGRTGEAEASYRRGLALKPASVDGLNNLGVLLEQIGRFDEAEASYRRAIELAPQIAHLHNNLGVLLKESGRLAAALAAHRRAVELNPALPAAHSNMLYTLNYDEAVLPQSLHAAHQAWGRIPGVRFETAGLRFTNPPDPSRRLRVGYVSGDLRHHSVAFFVEPLIAAHDRGAVEVFLYANDTRADEVTERLKRLADRWVQIETLSDELAAARIRQDGIDILVDLSGHTSRNRLLLFARQPAPAQVSWLGYPNTTGLTTIEYRLTDAVADPPGEADAIHTERLVRLDRAFLCYRPPASAGPVAPLPAVPAGHVTFGSFNNFAKLSPRTVALWSRLLRDVPDSRLLLKAPQFKDRATRQRCVAAFAAEGIAGDRLDVSRPLATTEDHLALYGRVDIALDPLAYNGTATTCEALWMGVPVVTLCGDRHAARVGASLLTAIGLGSLVAATADDYVAVAAALARDLPRLAALREGLRERMRTSPLCDETGFAGAVETAFRTMWRDWCTAQGTDGGSGRGTVRPAGRTALEAAEAAAQRLYDAGSWDEAERMLRRLIDRAPERAHAWFLLGRVRHAKGDGDAAIDFLRKALDIDPNLVAAHNDLGLFLHNQGRLEEAESHYRRAIEINPRLAEAMTNLGAVLAAGGRLDDATSWYGRAISADSQLAPAHNNLGAALVKLDRPEEAEVLHRRAIALNPRFADAHYNLGVALHDQGRFDEALASYGTAIELRSEFVDARWNRAFGLLLKGDYAEGWREHEWRWRRKQQPPRNFAKPLWRGEPIEGRSILLHAEQGIGDTLQFMRFLPLVAARGARVVLMVQRPALRLAAGSCPIGVQVIADGDMPPDFDLHCPLLTLPLCLGTTLETVPAEVPYLTVDADAGARWRQRLGAAGGRKVGLVWAGNPQHANDRNRSIAFERLAPLLGIAGISWFSLQVGERRADLAQAPAGTIVDLSDGLADFAETAAAIAALDLTICVDTAAAHLAGALARPVWAMIPAVPDWRWLIGREDSPWYPSMRIFRQPRRGDWDAVVRRIGEALARQDS